MVAPTYTQHIPQQAPRKPDRICMLRVGPLHAAHVSAWLRTVNVKESQDRAVETGDEGMRALRDKGR